MIRDLNQVNLGSSGTIVPGQTHAVSPFPREAAQTLPLSDSNALLYGAAAETWVAPSSGISVLSVKNDADYLHFLLDKPVCLHSGTQFGLSALKSDAAAMLYSKEKPNALGTLSVQSSRTDRSMQVGSIRTFFQRQMEPGFLFPGDSHSMPELTYVQEGELHSVVDGQDLLLKQGDLVVYGPDQWHMQYADIGVAPRFVTISFHLDGINLTPLLNQRFAAAGNIRHLMQRMLEEYARMDRFSPGVIASQLTLLLLSLLREAVPAVEARKRGANVVQNDNEIIRQAQQYVAAHIREKLSVPMVAANVDVSPSYLTILFHKNLQISPGEYIRRIKLQESKQMIRENNLNFTQIAAALHYSTVHHFSRQFKDKFGITPTEYANSVR